MVVSMLVDRYLASSSSRPIDFLKNSLLDTTKHSTFIEIAPGLKLRGDVSDDLGDSIRSLSRGDGRGEIDEDEGDANARFERGTETSDDGEVGGGELRRSDSSSKCWASTRKGKLNEKIDPLPITLWVKMMLEGLLMLFTKDKVIESPRPVPSNTRVELESA